MAWPSPTERPYGPRRLFPHSRAACSLSPPHGPLPCISSLEMYYENVKALWDERFEKKYGYRRVFAPPSVKPFADDGPT